MRKNNSYQNLSDEEISLQIAELDENLLKLKEERKVIEESILIGAEAIETIIKSSIEDAMNKFNKKIQ